LKITKERTRQIQCKDIQKLIAYDIDKIIELILSI
jgi:DNA-directed RNA polymerase sigma subunit (sigma70/sigma32)